VPIECPKCKRVNPDTARRCDCGHEFSAVTVQAERPGQATDSPPRIPKVVATKCPHCGGGNIVVELKLGQTAEVGSIGPEFRAGIFTGNEALYIDLCRDCGTVTRTYVKNTKKDWMSPASKRPGCLGTVLLVLVLGVGACMTVGRLLAG
jgi:hypothetical protein